jgi:hypothetical protein
MGGRIVTVDEMLDGIRDALRGVSWGLADVESVERQPNDWLRVKFANGETLAVTVEAL